LCSIKCSARRVDIDDQHSAGAVDFSLMLPRPGVSDKREAPASLADGYPRVISLGRKEEVFAVECTVLAGVKDQIDAKNRSVNAARSYLWRDAALLLD
jgi:hypothetical protein